MRSAAVAAIALVASGCATTAPREAHWVDAAAWPAGELRAVQRIELRAGGEVRSLLGVVEASAVQVRVAVLDALGRRLLLIGSGREGYTEMRAGGVPRSVDGRAILADIVLANWPTEDLRALLPSGLALETGGGRRTLSDREGVLAQVDCTGVAWQGRCVVEHPRAGQVLVVESRRESG